MSYLQLDIQVDGEQKELLLALLADLPFESFEETDTGWRAFLLTSAWSEQLEKQLIEIEERVPFIWTSRVLPEKNWNEVWESQFQPVVVEDFCQIRASFHQARPDLPFDILIHPKMAFGTGHHATTYMMVQQMRNMEFEGKMVLDFGCGTGVLAILASMLGATAVVAIDIEEPAVENSLEHAALNGVDMEVKLGSLEVVAGRRFDIILANITRNVITAHLPALKQQLNDGGKLLLSGVLVEDENLLREALQQHGLIPGESFRRGDWLCMHALNHRA